MTESSDKIERGLTAAEAIAKAAAEAAAEAAAKAASMLDESPSEALSMSWPDNGLSVEAEVTTDWNVDLEQSAVSTVKIRVTSLYGLTVTVELRGIERFGANTWKELAAGKNAKLGLTDSNGDATVTSDKGIVIFTASRYGCDDDSGIAIHGPARFFTRAFEYIADRVAAVEKRGVKQ
jgi:hypothetical protein